MFNAIDVSLEFEENQIELSEDAFQAAIILAMKSLHGQMGAAIPIQILYHDNQVNRAYIQVPKKYSVKVCSALTLFNSFLESPCAFRIHQVKADARELKICDAMVKNNILNKFDQS